MAHVGGRSLALVRLLGVQAAWNYERMQGTGMGHAAEPVLRAAFPDDAQRYRDSLARASAFFNANPYLAAAAVGAETRAEVDGVPGPTVERLRTALCGPLGSLGDRLFWTGLVPAGASAAIAGVALGWGWWPVLGFVVVHNVIRLALGPWLFGLGWRHGVQVGGAIMKSPLPRASVVAGELAAILGGLAIPLVARRFLADTGLTDLVGVAALVLGALIVRKLTGPRLSALPLTLAAAFAVLLWHWGRP
jgi:PTS system mannose-specific IID component